MRYIVLLITGIMCRAGTPPQQPPAAPCTMASDANLFEFLRAHDCIVASGDLSPPAVDVRLVRGAADHDSIAFRVELENRGTEPAVLDLVLHDQRLCFELHGGRQPPSYACALLEKAPARVESRARVLLPPHVIARVDNLGFSTHMLAERHEKHAIAAFWVPLPRGDYAISVSVPLPQPMLLKTTVSVP